MSTVVYVSGAPGSGKSTLMAALTGACRRVPRFDLSPTAQQLAAQDAAGAESVLGPPPKPLAAQQQRVSLCEDLLHPLRGLVGVELGARRPQFSGTDALSMSINPVACAWIAHTTVELVLGEGDRLANARFLDAARETGRDVWLVHLDASAALVDERCARRGSRQSAAWRAGRATKALRLAAWWEATDPARLVTLAARRPVTELAGELVARIAALAPLMPAPETPLVFPAVPVEWQ